MGNERCGMAQATAPDQSRVRIITTAQPLNGTHRTGPALGALAAPRETSVEHTDEVVGQRGAAPRDAAQERQVAARIVRLTAKPDARRRRTVTMRSAGARLRSGRELASVAMRRAAVVRARVFILRVVIFMTLSSVRGASVEAG